MIRSIFKFYFDIKKVEKENIEDYLSFCIFKGYFDLNKGVRKVLEGSNRLFNQNLGSHVA